MMTAQNTFSNCDVIGFHCANADFSAKDHLVPSCLLLCHVCIDFVLHNFENFTNETDSENSNSSIVAKSCSFPESKKMHVFILF